MAADAISERRDLLRDYAMRELTQPNKAQAFVNIVAKAVEINGGRNSEVVFSDLQAVLIGEGMTGDEGRNKGPHFAGGDYVLSGAAGFKPEFRYHDDGTIPIGRTFQHMLGKFPAGSYLGPREPCLSELPQMLLDAICDETCHVPTPEDLSTDSDSWAFDMQADAEARSFSMEDDADQRGSFSGTLPLESADNASDASQPGTADVDGDGTPDMSTPDDAGALPLPDDEEDAAARAPTRDGEDAAPATPSADATSPAGGSGQAGHPDDDATADLTSGLHKNKALSGTASGQTFRMDQDAASGGALDGSEVPKMVRWAEEAAAARERMLYREDAASGPSAGDASPSGEPEQVSYHPDDDASATWPLPADVSDSSDPLIWPLPDDPSDGSGVADRADWVTADPPDGPGQLGGPSVADEDLPLPGGEDDGAAADDDQAADRSDAGQEEEDEEDDEEAEQEAQAQGGY